MMNEQCNLLMKIIPFLRITKPTVIRPATILQSSKAQEMANYIRLLIVGLLLCPLTCFMIRKVLYDFY